MWSAGDFENFRADRPDLDANPKWREELTAVVRTLVRKRWPIRIHATYDETIVRILSVFEAVDREEKAAGRPGFTGLRWAMDHVETIKPAQIARIKALGGGVMIQDRMAFAGEDFIKRYGAEAAGHAPPITALLAAGIPVGAGTDGTRVASYNPWPSLYWMVSGKSVGGTQLMAKTKSRRSREGARVLHRRQRVVQRRGKRQGSPRTGPVRRHGLAERGLLHRARSAHSPHRIGAHGHRRQPRLRGRAITRTSCRNSTRSCRRGRRCGPSAATTTRRGSDGDQSKPWITSRRRLLIGAASAIPALALGSLAGARWASASAHPAGIPVRRSIGGLSPDDPYVKLFRDGVAILRKRSERDPLDPTGWDALAIQHALYCSSVTPELQIHWGWDFLTWHRAFSWSVERVLRDAVKEPQFALPYWDSTRHRSIPAAYWGNDNVLNDATRAMGPDDSFPMISSTCPARCRWTRTSLSAAIPMTTPVAT